MKYKKRDKCDVFGAIRVQVPAATKAEVAYYVDTVLSRLPMIEDGVSEAEISYIVSDKPTASSNRNRWFEFSNIGSDKGYTGECQYSFEYFSIATITISAALREKSYEEVLKDVERFLNRLSKRMLFLDMMIRVNSWSAKKHFIFEDSEYWSGKFNRNDPWLIEYMRTTLDYERDLIEGWKEDLQNE